MPFRLTVTYLFFIKGKAFEPVYIFAQIPFDVFSWHLSFRDIQTEFACNFFIWVHLKRFLRPTFTFGVIFFVRCLRRTHFNHREQVAWVKPTRSNFHILDIFIKLYTFSAN